MLFMCTNLKGFCAYLEVEEKGLGQGLGQESDADGFYSRIRISMMQDLLSLMFRVALLWIFKQETINPNNAYKHHNSKIKSERYN